MKLSMADSNAPLRPSGQDEKMETKTITRKSLMRKA